MSSPNGIVVALFGVLKLVAFRVARASVSPTGVKGRGCAIFSFGDCDTSRALEVGGVGAVPLKVGGGAKLISSSSSSPSTTPSDSGVVYQKNKHVLKVS